MRVGVLGINFKSADLSLREVMARACQRCFEHESALSSALSCVLLTTCNRTEVYFSAWDLAEAHSLLLHFLREKIEQPFEHKLYSYFGGECFCHLATVTVGLDSVVLAETEIQRQVKRAYENASLHHPLTRAMHFLFQKCLKIGKSVRSSHLLSRSQMSLEEIIFSTSQHLSEEIEKASILFVGNSEINRKILCFFKKKGVKRIALCTRALHSAEELKCEHALELLHWESLSSWHEYDFVIFGTNQHDYLLTPEQWEEGVAFKTKMIFDLGVPRNVDPRLARHPRVNLLNIEELGHLLERKQSVYREEVSHIEGIIRGAVETQVSLFYQRESRRKECV